MSQRATQLHQNSWQGVFYLTGGGSGLLSEMLTTPGASATVLDASIPYAGAALAQLLGGTPEQAVSAATARQMAAAAYQRATHLASPLHTDLFGFGCTATLATTRRKRGKHRAHWVVQTATLTASYDITFDAEKNNRAEEEQQLVDAIWQSLESLFNTPSTVPSSMHNCKLVTAEESFAPLLQNDPYRVCVGEHDGSLILPGSFNPIHDGHRELMAAAEQLTGLPGAYELAVRNADKPSLDYITLEERFLAISNTPVWLTNTANFVDKAGLFPRTTFALGVDTLMRIGDPRFYQDDPGLMQQAVQTLADTGAQFLVFGRVHDNKFITLDDVAIPGQLRKLCRGVPEDAYRNDLSSTALRKQRSATD